MTKGITADMSVESDTETYLIVYIDQHRFGFELDRVNEILPLMRLHSMPFMPACVRGVINLRGRIVPVIDASARLGKQLIDASTRTNMLMIDMSVQQAGTVFSVMINHIDGVMAVDGEHIEDKLPFGMKVHKSFVRGVTHDAHGVIVLLDIATFLSVEQLTECIGNVAHW